MLKLFLTLASSRKPSFMLLINLILFNVAGCVCKRSLRELGKGQETPWKDGLTIRGGSSCSAH